MTDCVSVHRFPHFFERSLVCCCRFCFWFSVSTLPLRNRSGLTTGLNCDSSQIYVTVIKNSRAMAYQESFNINYNGNILAYGQYAVDYQTQTMEYCLQNYDSGRFNIDMSLNIFKALCVPYFLIGNIPVI